MNLYWKKENKEDKENIYLLFKSTLKLKEKSKVKFNVAGKDNFRFILDKKERGYGPNRMTPKKIEYMEYEYDLLSGEHEVECIVHKYGVETRFSDVKINPFFGMEIYVNEKLVELDFMVAKLEYYKNLSVRNNPMLGWMECIDYVEKEKNSLAFEKPIPADFKWDEKYPSLIRQIKDYKVESEFQEKGEFIDRFGVVNYNPAHKFNSRDLYPKIKAQGVWYRYDFKLIGLHRPNIEIYVNKETTLELGYSSYLFGGRVNTHLSLSSDYASNVDRFILKKGMNRINTFSYRGFRFLELHLYAKEGEYEIKEVTAYKRSYYKDNGISFKSSDYKLDKIWNMCKETVISCSEDALTDTPVRERGQWTGDMMASGIENISYLFGDMSLPKRSIIQAYEMRNEKGLVPGQYPGHIHIIPMYSLMWIEGSINYFEAANDIDTIKKVYDGFDQTIDTFMNNISKKGVLKIKDSMDFIDWGYINIKNGLIDVLGEINVCLNLYLLGVMKKLIEIDKLLGDNKILKKRQKQIQKLSEIKDKYFKNEEGLYKKYVYLDENKEEKTGFNSNAIALYFGLDNKTCEKGLIKYIKKYIENAYPNNKDGNIIDDPDLNIDDGITPYFAHFYLSALFERNEGDFVLDNIRNLWGWMLEMGATTALEVFDIRWSHCHAWSAPPAYQIPKYILGIKRKKDKIFFEPKLTSLEKASYYFPNEKIQVNYTFKNDIREYEITNKSNKNINLIEIERYNTQIIRDNRDENSFLIRII